MKEYTTKLAQLISDYESSKCKIKRISEQLRKATSKRNSLERAIRREHLRQNVGGKVKRRYRSSSNPQLNDAIGVLLEVRRTRCTIDFGAAGKWNFLLDDVALLHEEQGLYMEVMS